MQASSSPTRVQSQLPNTSSVGFEVRRKHVYQRFTRVVAIIWLTVTGFTDGLSVGGYGLGRRGARTCAPRDFGHDLALPLPQHARWAHDQRAAAPVPRRPLPRLARVHHLRPLRIPTPPPGQPPALTFSDATRPLLWVSINKVLNCQHTRTFQQTATLVGLHLQFY